MKPFYTNDQVVAQLDSGDHWYTGTVSYGFPAVAESWTFYSWAGEGPGFSPFTAEQMAGARLAIRLWDDLVAVDFVEQADGNNATIQYSNSSTNVSYAHAYYPGTGDWSGTIWLNAQGHSSLYHPQVGSYAFQTLLHETGHALGLDHPGDYSGSVNYEDDAIYAQDSRQYTVMSYFSAKNTGAQWYGSDGVWKSAQTPMVHDVLAIQAIYGADPDTRSGDTVYGFGATTDEELFDFSLNPDPVLTIYDAGGNDTLDFSGWSFDATMDLTPGAYSSGGGFTVSYPMIHNIGIAYGSWIENAVGGSGDDSIQGNDLANRLDGGAGSDSLDGLDGNDTLVGSAGADLLDGGPGRDWVDYSGSNAAVTIDLSDGQPESGGYAEGDTLVDLESIRGSLYDDTLVGDAAAQRLQGHQGDDLLVGGAGNDTLQGDSGADVMDGGAGSDMVFYNMSASGVHVDLGDGRAELGGDAEGDLLSSIEGILGSSHDDTLIGDDGGNILKGRGGADLLAGADGSDLLIGGAGGDTLDGGEGHDLVSYSSSGQAVQIDLSDAAAESGGDAAGDVLISVEEILATRYDDVLIGGGGGERLRGYAGSDQIDGDAGDDTLIGGSAPDLIQGGTGQDWLLGQDGDDALFGGPGDDRLRGNAGADTLDGGEGHDWALYTDSDAAVRVDLSDGLAESGGTAQGDVLVDIEWLLGSRYGDTLVGDDAANVLRGKEGDDLLSGGAGRDILRGDEGDDTLMGGEGDDVFRFYQGFGSDHILDFDTLDMLSFGGTGFNGDDAGFLALYGHQVGSDYRIDLGDFGVVTIDGVGQDDLLGHLLLS